MTPIDVFDVFNVEHSKDDVMAEVNGGRVEMG